jgi:membrane peptidoglycan carboxypeptidase
MTSRRSSSLPSFPPDDKGAAHSVDRAGARGRTPSALRAGARLRVVAWSLAGVLGAAIVAVVGREVHTSAFQSRWITGYAQHLTWVVADGSASTALRAPRGPYDVRHGYAQFPELQRRLVEAGFRVARQAQPSPQLGNLAQMGIYPPYDEKSEPALVVVDSNGRKLYNARPEEHLFREFVDIPPVIVRALLFVENRQLLDESRPSLNPALEWDRLVLSGWRFAMDRLFGTGKLSGGSTLATQVQKFRHSPGGRTGSLRDKAVQMVTASLRAYRIGSDTRRARRRVVVDYLNGLPLGAAAGVGEVRGLGAGMAIWFGKSLEQLVVDLSRPEGGASLLVKGRSFKEALALILATRRPGLYLGPNRTALEERLEFYVRELARERIISWELAAATHRAPLELRAPAGPVTQPRFVDLKAANAIRTELLQLLGVEGLYQLDHLDVRVETTFDVPAQASVRSALQRLSDASFLEERGFVGPSLLHTSSADDIVYTFALYESSPKGNRLLVQADNLDRPLDMNEGAKVELGSTAKLRALANYLNVVAIVHRRHHEKSTRKLHAAERAALDPITRWAVRRMRTHRNESLERLLWAAVERELSAEPSRFFTGGGVHAFHNFDNRFSGDVAVRTAFHHSNNMVFVRLMRELVQFYTAELGYDEQTILADGDHPERQTLLKAAAERETRQHLSIAWRRFAQLPLQESVRELCGSDESALRRFAVFYLGRRPDASLDELVKAARGVFPGHAADLTTALAPHHIAHGRRDYSLTDQAWLMKREPLQIWLLRDRQLHPGASWVDVLERSAAARQESYAWLFQQRAKRAQELRLRTELERRAFSRMHAAWRALGYPFASLVPSLATAIGSSADRPAALADLLGIIQNEGVRAPVRRIQSLHFGEGTPYETHLVPATTIPERVMRPEVARVLKQLMLEVVEQGSAQRVRGVLRGNSGASVAIGGKTGSGDNRFSRFDKNGALVSSRAINRTASFAFFVGETHYGVITAQVLGEKADEYAFTSALALQAFNVLAPAIAELVSEPSQRVEVRPPPPNPG